MRLQFCRAMVRGRRVVRHGGEGRARGGGWGILMGLKDDNGSLVGGWRRRQRMRRRRTTVWVTPSCCIAVAGNRRLVALPRAEHLAEHHVAGAGRPAAAVDLVRQLLEGLRRELHRRQPPQLQPDPPRVCTCPGSGGRPCTQLD